MPEEIIPVSTRRKNIRLLVAVVLALLFVNFAVYFTGAFTKLDSGVFLIRSKWNLLRDIDSPVEWLILGDSSANQGVIPDKFRSEYGGRVVNLGTVANALLIEDVWMLQDYIESHGAPKNVIVVHVYDMWVREADTSVFAHVPWDYMGDIDLLQSLKDRCNKKVTLRCLLNIRTANGREASDDRHKIRN